MTERRRRDFHHEFATYRFRPLSEHGALAGPEPDRAAGPADLAYFGSGASSFEPSAL